MNILKKLFPFILLLLVSIPTVLPFFHPGFFPMHDDTQVQRVFEMKTALKDGMFPVRWVADLGYGYGYPIFNFYAPLPYYIGGFLNLLGIDALLATKIMMAVIVVASSFSMYFLSTQFWGKWGGLLSASLYVFAPYHALNTYVRGDVGELYAYFFIPLIFYGIWRYYKTENFKYFLIGSLSYAGLITSHNLSAMMMTPFIFVIVAILIYIKRKFSILLLPLLGILLASFYFIPALLEMKYTNVLKIIGEYSSPYKEHFVCPVQLWDSLWLYGGSAPGCIDGLSFRIGKLHVLVTIISLIFSLALFKKEKQKFWIILFSIFGLIFSIYLLLDISVNVWNVVPYMNFFQYPWRFLLLVSFFSSFVGGSILFFVIQIFKKNKYKPIVLGGVILAIFVPLVYYLNIFIPQQYVNKDSKDYTQKSFLNWETSKISDEYMPKNFKPPKTKDEIFKEKIWGKNVNSADVSERTNYLSGKVIVSKDTQVDVHIAYFPAWNYYINGKSIEVIETESGVSFPLAKGVSVLEAKFEQTSIEKVANMLTITGIVSLVAGIIYTSRKKYEKT